ncbi:flagellar hook-associated protein FlgK [Fundidesulfovibrio agrisoli]|uniref:flagellar hook-associated protein FlgK n=1 Tax=Fundidesulfovibrio agrisoli TaxID=2922717 RepID=UPI001FACD8F1|nr:flagellar hook-associated protein FlgK [Fundidesulfovibrio agrisoli]
MLNNLLNIGQTALSNFQVALNVTGGNIANSSTEGYARRTVTMQEDTVSRSGLGTGASIQSIVRALDKFLQRRTLEQTAQTSYCETIATNLAQVESLFNDSSGDSGITTTLNTFMTSLSDLSASASNSAARNQVITDAQSLSEQLNSIQDSLATQVASVNDSIASQVDTVNGLLEQIAGINKVIGGTDQASGLQDQRDLLISQLSGYLDVNVITRDDGQVRVLTAEGQNLVDGSETYSLQVGAPRASAALTGDSAFDGKLYFEGSSSNELTVRMVSAGDCSGGSTAATYNVSLDGGKTWVTNEDGSVRNFTAGDSAHKETVDGVSLWFGTATSADTAPSTSLSAGDGFDVMPKTGLYWITATGGKVNVTPLTGNDNANRLSGGSLAGLFALRDQYIGGYQDSLDAFSESLIWNANRAHSQGAGLTTMSEAQGEYAVKDASVPLSQSGLYWADKLASGNVSIALYDSSTGENISVSGLDFSSVTPGTATFDPAVHSLDDVAAAINASYSGQLSASVQNGQLSIQAADGVGFQFAEDSSGLLAGLGINTLFSGTDAASIAVNSVVADDPNRLCAGHVNGGGEVNSGDNTTALALAALASDSVGFTQAKGSTSGTLQDFMTALASRTGSDTDAMSTRYTYAQTLSDDLTTQRESVSGVSLDEELTRVMQYQQAYKAAAKLITTASEMFETVLGLVQ